jgi:pimeloyl-ACP methyl ester carboxylesterase
VSRRIVLVVALVAALLASSVPHAQAATRAAEPLVWRGCRDGFECAALEVPVDYSAPAGEQVAIALIRRLATNPDTRIGSLVVNYGGPGDPGTETLRAVYGALPSEIRERFDVVSFDPRGTGHSRAVDCVDDATFDRAWAEDVTPDNRAELPAFYDGTAFSVDLIGACVDRHGEWLAHVGTRNVARDLDRLRAVLGDAKLTYLGFSYGTLIGAVYAQEFPGRVRALVLDSAVNASTTPEQRQRGNARGFEDALEEFLAACADDDSCPFRSDGAPRDALLRLRDEFEAGLTIETVDGRTVGVTEFYVGMLAALYSRGAWGDLAEGLRMARDDRDGSYLRLFNDLYAGRREDGSYNNLQEAIGVINCADQPFARVPFAEFRAKFTELTTRYPVFGRAFAGAPLGCDPRLPTPAPDEQLGDVRATDAPPLLIIGVTQDPATPYAGAVDLQRRIRGSRILTLDATQHGGYTSGILCIDTAVDAYLIERKLPPRNARCES